MPKKLTHQEIVTFDDMMDVNRQYHGICDHIETFIEEYLKTKRDDHRLMHDVCNETLSVYRYDSENAILVGYDWAMDEFIEMPLAFVYSAEFREHAHAECEKRLAVRAEKEKNKVSDVAAARAVRYAQYQLLKAEFE